MLHASGLTSLTRVNTQYVNWCLDESVCNIIFENLKVRVFFRNEYHGLLLGTLWNIEVHSGCCIVPTNQHFVWGSHVTGSTCRWPKTFLSLFCVTFFTIKLHSLVDIFSSPLIMVCKIFY